VLLRHWRRCPKCRKHGAPRAAFNAVLYSARTVSGFALVVSSVTYITGTPSLYGETDRVFGVFSTEVRLSSLQHTDGSGWIRECAGFDHYSGFCEISIIGVMSFRWFGLRN